MLKMTKFGVFVCSLSMVAFGCGSSGGGGEIDNPAAEAAAGRTVDSAAALADLANEPDSTSGISAVFDSYTSLATVANAGVAGQTLTQKGGGTDGGLNDCITATETMVTYDNCDLGLGMIDGTLSVSGGEVTFDLTVAASGLTFTLEGALTVSDTAIGGTLTATTSISGFSTTLVANYDVTLTDGCATGGTIDVDQRGALSSDVQVQFGPACGDVALFG